MDHPMARLDNLIIYLELTQYYFNKSFGPLSKRWSFGFMVRILESSYLATIVSQHREWLLSQLSELVTA